MNVFLGVIAGLLLALSGVNAHLGSAWVPWSGALIGGFILGSVVVGGLGR